MNYCLGFVTDEEGRHVLLMEKRRPSWQAGQFNGIGGKLERSESAEQAMIRECQEETGLNIQTWHPLGKVNFSGGSVEVFYAQADLSMAIQTTDEPVIVANLADAIMGRYPLVDEVGIMLSKLWSTLHPV